MIQELLGRLRRRDIRVWAEGDRLRFNAPRGAMTPELQEDIASNKDALLRFLGSVAASEDSPPPIERASRGEPLPLSYAQQRVWFLQKFDPESPAYNVPAEVVGNKHTRPDILARALGELLKRHEILRTRIVTREGEPFQVIEPYRPVELPVVDLTTLDGDDEIKETGRLARQEAGRPFDLEKGPLVRYFYLERYPDKPVLVLTQHHIVTDRWSLGLLARELGALHRQLYGETVDDLPQLPVQYADYALWQREWLEGPVLEKELAYWKPQLSGAPPLLSLPTDRPRPKSRTYRGAWQWLPLGKDLSEQVKQLSREQGVTPFTALLSAFYVLLHRYSRETDISVGTPVTGRSRQELENLIGLFVNTLVLRCDLSGEPTFTELLQRVRSVALDAFSHADMPFEKLVEALSPERDTSRSPLFQVMFVLQNAPASVEVERIDSIFLRASGATMFDMTLILSESADGLTATCEYATDLFDASTVERMLAHYRRLLEAAVVEPDMPVSELPLLEDEERRRDLALWNDTARSFSETTIHARFEDRVRENPLASAVVAGAEILTYGELDARSNRLARRLQALGVSRGDLVGVSLPRSAEIPVALFGILKAGAAYVPLDPGFPEGRLRFMERDSGMKLRIDRDWLDRERDALERASETPLAGASAADDLAYVIYTSGSTGTPKGVAVSHRSVVNFLDSMRERPGLSPRDVLLSVTTLSFDIAGLELYLPLTTGASVVLAGAEAVLDARQLARLLDDAGATVLQATPATWRLLLEGGWQGKKGLRMLCGGEALSRELARELLPMGASLWNLYGPTETTIWSAIHSVESAENGVPIGKPIANTRMYVVDERLAPVPAGVVGELVIGGDGVAWGYLGRPGLTAERFVPDPFAAAPGARLYRTGDLARVRADGTFECLGRNDQQVKVRGFRVELSEIESALLEHEGVREAVVVARTAPEGKRLAAFVTPSGRTLLTAADLRGHLRERLPAYMVPGHFTTIDALPLTPNGKVDRRALAERDDGDARPETEFEAPRTEIEESIALVFSGILGLRGVSIHDNFFELGGHSLLAAQVVSRMLTRFGVEIPLRVLFERPTVAALAAHLAERTATDAGAVASIPRVDRAAGVFPLSFAQQRYWFLDQLEPGNPAYNIHLPLAIYEPVDRDALARALEEVVRRHEALRTSFETVRGEPVSRIEPPGSFSLYEVNLSGLPESQKEARAAEEASALAVASFDLTRAPLFRAGLFRLGPEHSVLSLVTHHVICDRWSLGILVKEFLVLYAAFRKGAPSPLPELPIQYVDFASWQRSHLQGEGLDRQLSFWKKALEGRLPILELPTDRPRPQIQTFSGSTRSRTLSRSLRDDLEKLGQGQRATLFMTVLAGFSVLLHRYTGERDILVGSPVANRTRPEVEPVVGFFANTLVLRTSLEGNPTFRELVSRVRDTALDAFSHQDLPFEKLVEDLRPERNLGQNPIFQVLFTFQNPSAPAKVRRNDKLGIFPVESRTAQFDLSAYIDDTSHGLVVTFEFNTDLFDTETIERMLSHFEALLASVRSEPDRRVSEVEILTNAERRALAEAADGGRATIEPELAHRLFAEQASRAPGAVAVELEGHQYTYRELEERANRLGHWLRTRGVGREAVVGVAMESSFELVVSLLAVMKAGGAYLPLDPAFPADRLRLMLEDSRAALVLTTEALRESLPSTTAELAAIDAEPVRVLLERESAEPLNVEVERENLAYLIYTSGSTGRPKGVSVPHGALASFLAAMRAEPGLSPSDTLLSVTTFSFDIAALEIFLPLVTGARLVLVSRDAARDGRTLLEAAQVSGATVLQATPATFRLLVEAGWRSNGHPLRTLSGGEALAPDLAAGLLERSTAVFNLYGPTETTIWSMAKRLSTEDGRVSLGRPIPGTRVYVLDSNLQPVPPGVTGEIAIAGEGVTRGYYGQPDRTAERFLPDPFAAEPGGRMYRTGDLARRRADGEIEYLGRNDFQVKVRGFRIELGDIESALREIRGVRQAVVLAHGMAGASVRLVAYVVYEGAAAPTVTELRSALKEKLPLYMVPSSFVSVDALPLTPNGKVDRRALESEREEARGASHVEPRTAMERLVASIWRDVLERERVSLHDNFFDLGGHSLLSMKVVARLEDEIGERVNPRELIFQTLEQFAAACEAQSRRRVEVRPGLLGKVMDRLKSLAPRMQ